ncbi:putatice ATPase [Bacillus sp. TS-2]|nr:putatice ATPase [Bacillus sp. TS-2]
MLKQEQVGLSLDSNTLEKAKQLTGDKMFRRELRHFIHNILERPSITEVKKIEKGTEVIQPLRFYPETLEIIDSHIDAYKKEGKTWVNRSNYMRYVIVAFISNQEQKYTKEVKIPTTKRIEDTVIETIESNTLFRDFSHAVSDYIQNEYEHSPQLLNMTSYKTTVKKVILTKQAHEILSEVAKEYNTSLNKVLFHATSKLAEKLSNTKYDDLLLNYRLKSAVMQSKERYGVKETREIVENYLVEKERD